MARYAHVALPLPLRRTFVYRLPDSLLSRVRPGSQVQVPFRGRPRRGIVVELSGANGREDAHEIGTVLGEPLFDPHLLEFTRWVADYYLAPWGEVLAGALPGGGEGMSRSRGRRAAVEDPVLAAPLPDRFPLSPEQRAAVQAIERALLAQAFAPMLLQGVTASGKTEVYLRAAAAAREHGGQTLLLVPEVALSSQLVREFRR